MRYRQVSFEEGVAKYLPKGALEEVVRLWNKTPYQLTITRERLSKKGDFRLKRGGIPAISVNGTLNPYEFLLVLLHEYAHFMVHQKYGSRVKSHGEEWKHEFRTYMLPFFNLVDFPPRLGIAMFNYMRNPKAASGTDINLQREFSKYDPPSDVLVVEDLEDGDYFIFKARIFKREQKLRKRYLCEEVRTGRQYRFSPLAEVEKYEKK